MVGEVESETPRERLRFSESKVYKRKSLKVNKNSDSSSALEGSEKGNIISGLRPNFANSDEAVQEVNGDSGADDVDIVNGDSGDDDVDIVNGDSKNQCESATRVVVDEGHGKSNDTANDVDHQHVENVEGGSEALKNEEVTKVGSDCGIEEEDARREKRQKLTHDKVELRMKLESELVLIRDLVKKIDEKQRELRRVISDSQPKSKPMLKVSIIDSHQAVAEGVEKEKEKRTPKANQFYRNSEFLLAKDKFPPAENNKKAKYNGKKHGGDSNFGFGSGSKTFKRCSGLLERLMKHKHGWVFNTPVDADGLGLHDYHTIIKHPMDLGTIKSLMMKNCYKAPDELAKDVRLTFHNAMTYNPKGQDVHAMAEQLLNIFEEKWEAIKMEHDREMRFSSMAHAGFSTPQPRKAPPLPDSRRVLSRSASIPVSNPSGRISAPKKPKAKDENKRDMTYEEKQRLSTNLQGLPYEKLDNIVQIIKKRNSTVSHQDDEIEVDIDSVDPETLWELDRFVTNYKKSLSKTKRRAELAKQARAAAEQKALHPPTTEADSSPNHVLRNEDEKRDKSSTSSSSSSSDSGSSSSDSDSDSSSASGSDVGDS